MGNESSLPTQPSRPPDLPTVKLIRPLNIEKTETLANPAHETGYIVAGKVSHIMEAPCTAASATSKGYDASKTQPQELSSEVLQSIREYVSANPFAIGIAVAAGWRVSVIEKPPASEP